MKIMTRVVVFVHIVMHSPTIYWSLGLLHLGLLVMFEFIHLWHNRPQ